MKQTREQVVADLCKERTKKELAVRVMSVVDQLDVQRKELRQFMDILDTSEELLKSSDLERDKARDECATYRRRYPVLQHDAELLQDKSRAAVVALLELFDADRMVGVTSDLTEALLNSFITPKSTD